MIKNFSLLSQHSGSVLFVVTYLIIFAVISNLALLLLTCPKIVFIILAGNVFSYLIWQCFFALLAATKSDTLSNHLKSWMPHFWCYKSLNFCSSWVSLQSRTKYLRVCVYANKMEEGFVVVACFCLFSILKCSWETFQFLLPTPLRLQLGTLKDWRYMAWHRRRKTSSF